MHAGFLACPACSSADLEYEFVVDKFPVSRCKACLLLFLNPQPPASTAQPEQRNAQAADANGRDGDAVADLLVREVLGYRQDGPCRVLAVNLPVSEAQSFPPGVQLTNVAPDAFAAQPQAIAQTYDACILHSCLDRFPEPARIVALARERLVDAGVLLVSVPSIDSPAARRAKNAWPYFGRGRYYYFGVNTLQNLLFRSAFRAPIVHGATEFRATPEIARLADQVTAPLRMNDPLRTFRDNFVTVVSSKSEPLSRERLSIIVPVYNERATFAESIEAVLSKEIDGVDIEIVIIESNSSDGTREEVLRYAGHPRVKLILQDKARGKGFAVRAGLAQATGTIVLFQDADLEYDVADYDTLIRPLRAYQQTFVLGSRHNVFGRSWKIRTFESRPMLAQLFNVGHLFFLFVFNKLYGQNLTDPFTMFKVFRRDCLYGLTFECNRFDFDHEIVIKLIRKGYLPVEIPVNYRSRSVDDGKKVTLFGDPLTWLRALWKFRNSPLYARTGLERDR